jgi:hypothetical protein
MKRWARDECFLLVTGPATVGGGCEIVKRPGCESTGSWSGMMIDIRNLTFDSRATGDGV